MTSTLLISGPPRSGKTTAAQQLLSILEEETISGCIVSLSRPIKEGAHALYQALNGGRGAVSVDHFEETKDEPNPFFFGRTPRQAYIAVHEGLYLPLHGQEFVSELASSRLLRTSYKIAIVPDLGNEAQMIPFGKKFRRVDVLCLNRLGAKWSDNRRTVAGSRLFASGNFYRHEYDNDGSVADLRRYLKNEVLPRLLAGV